MNSVKQSTFYLRVAILAGVAVTTLVAWLLRESITPRIQGMVGILAFLGIACAFSADIHCIPRRTVVVGLAMQFALALMIIHLSFVREFFGLMGRIVTRFLEFSNEGALFVFGPLADPKRSDYAFGKNEGFVFAARALPTVIFVSAVFTVMYYLRILQMVVYVFAWLMVRLFGKEGVSGAEALAATANIFMGQTEAPLVIKRYVREMTDSELLALMIGGMATIAGGVMALYIFFGANAVAILATSAMAAPCGLYLSKILLPEKETPKTRGKVELADEQPYANAIDAASNGARDGVFLVINIIAMLIAFVAGIAMINFLLKEGSIALGLSTVITLERIFGWLFSPAAFLMGVPSADVIRIGELLGEKLVLTEMIAFRDLTTQNLDPQTKAVVGIQERSFILAVYALTGFANIASIGIQLGGIGAIAENKKATLAKLGMIALLGGFLATLINASVAGILLPS